jgi:raffinose/stachyose/melibiose transport system substrate-binding protein
MTSFSRRSALKAGGAAAGALLLPNLRRVAAQETTLKFWNGFYTVEDPNDKTKDKSEFYIYQAIERFKAKNPGINIEIETVPGDPSMFVKYRTASVAQNGPDLMALWSGTYMLNLKDFIEPLGPYFTAEEKARIRGWEAVTPDFSADNPDIYGVPPSTDGVCVLYYNKELVSKAGLDFETALPQDIDDFITALDAIKGSGVSPFSLNDYGYVWQVLFYWIGQNIGGAQGYGELGAGTRKFNDPALVNIVDQWQRLVDYTAEGTTEPGSELSNQLFLSEETALTTNGAWSITDYGTALGDKLGMVKLPNFNADAGILNGGIGGSGQCLIVSNYSQQKDAAVAFIKYMVSAEEQTEKAKSPTGGLINVTDVDATQFYTSEFLKQQQTWAYEPSTIFWPDNTLPADLTTEINAQAQLVWSGASSSADFLQALDDKRDSLLG